MYTYNSITDTMHTPKMECHAINTHSYFLHSDKTSNLTTSMVPKNMFIFMLGTLGKYTKDPENENLGEKWARGIDTEFDSDAYNTPIHHWLKSRFASVGEFPMQEYGDVAVFLPGTHYPDRVLAPDKEAFVSNTQESKTMNYFTEVCEESFSLLLTQIERNEVEEKTNYHRCKMREAAKKAVATGMRSDGKAVMHLRFTLSRLCNYISKHNPEKITLLLVLGCPVIPTEINLSLNSPCSFSLINNYEIWINILKSIRIGREVISNLPRGKRERQVNISPDIEPAYRGIVHPDDDDIEEKGWHTEKTITQWKTEIISLQTGKRDYTDKRYYDLIDNFQVSKRENRLVNLLIRKIFSVGNDASVLVEI
jgi:hypothetical protein